jgi:hypothetical protein
MKKNLKVLLAVCWIAFGLSHASAQTSDTIFDGDMVVVKKVTQTFPRPYKQAKPEEVVLAINNNGGLLAHSVSFSYFFVLKESKDEYTFNHTKYEWNEPEQLYYREYNRFWILLFIIVAVFCTGRYLGNFNQEKSNDTSYLLKKDWLGFFHKYVISLIFAIAVSALCVVVSFPTTDVTSKQIIWDSPPSFVFELLIISFISCFLGYIFAPKSDSEEIRLSVLTGGLSYYLRMFVKS